MARNPKPTKRKGTPIPVRASRDAGELCLQCGLCCDGTMFAVILVQPGERAEVEALGLEVGELPTGALAAPEPCPAFVDGCCSLYTVGRPRTCGGYTCRVLDGYLAGTAYLDDCLGVIRLVRGIARELEAATGMEPGSYNRAAFQAWLVEHRPWEDPRANETAMVAFARMQALGVRHFGCEPLAFETAAAAAGESIMEQSSPV